MILMVMSTLFSVGVMYLLIGHGAVLGESLGGVIGNPADYLGMLGFYEDTGDQVSEITDFAFFALVACITVAIVASGVLGRMKFRAAGPCWWESSSLSPSPASTLSSSPGCWPR
ncbi:hypothetical protein [Nesterenkonia alkaliphila]|uniref:Ammonium transporter AmtB-like domain-containing protein n=1 Tax=Nesterenkonia alkaliphila TaxID=1463631 RepID=A0A7K1UHX1_9MICC|nr:hypothetical protein [Nesterenkonia alkaliphila]MVT26006.1 hypothetical protein [Nesterenkonia alkaliphila]